MPRNDLIQLRSDTAANWTSVNPILAVGEQGFETDTGKYKIGNGFAAWNSLSYLSATSNDDQISSLRRWHQQFAQTRQGLVSGTPYSTDVLWVGDSIGEGWSSNGITTMVNVFTDNLSRIANPNGRGGRWVPAGGDWYASPKFSDNDSTLLGTHTITGGTITGGTITGGAFPSNQVLLNENFATSIFPSSGNATITNYYIGYANISYTGKIGIGGKTVLTGVTITSNYFFVPSNPSFLSGSTVYFGGADNLRKGLSLRTRYLFPVIGQNIGAIATLEFTGDNVIVQYRKRRTLTGNIQFKLYLKDSSSAYQLIHTSSSISTYTSTGVDYAEELFAWNAETDYSGTLSRGDYKLEIYNHTIYPSGPSYNVLFDGAYICDGNTSQGVKVWNASLSGATFAIFNNTVDTVYNNDWLSALRNGLVNPSLVVIALGTNQSSNTSIIESGLTTMVDSIKAAYTVGFPDEPTPSFAFFVPPADSSMPSSEWALVRNTFASVASTVGAAIWNWAEFTGDVNSASSPTNGTGDPYGWTSDSIHPTTSGHRAIGDFATSQALSSVPIVGSFSRDAPVTKNGAFTLAVTDNWIICNGTSTFAVTLPAASTQVGREITIKTIAAFTVTSATSNVVPLAGGAAGNAILPATAGAWAKLVSDGTNWVIMQS